MPANTTQTGTVTALGGTVVVTLPSGCSSVALQVTGTWVGQLEFEGTVDGTNYQSVEASNGTTTINATASNDIFILPGGGYVKLQVRASAWTSGTANITFVASVGAAASILTGPIPAGTNAIGKLTTNSGVDIGDVDVLSLPAITIAAAQTLATVTTVGTITNVVHVDDNAGALSIDDGGGNISIDWGGTAPPIGAGLEATALRVTLATDSTGLVSVDDNGASLTVDNAALSVVGGGLEATALRVTLASDSTGLVSVDDNGGSLTIDNAQLSVVGSGTEATAMRVTIATDSTGVLSVDDNGASLTVDNAQLSVVGSGTEATALRVTIATDSTGVLSVDDNAGSLTVDNPALSVVGAGVVATAQRVTLGSDDPAVTALQLIDNAISGAGFNITQLGGAAVPIGAGTEAAAIRVTLPTDGTGLVGAGGNVAHDAADSGNPVKIGAKAYAFDGTAPQAVVAEADRVNLISDLQGIQYVQQAHPYHWQASVDYAAAQTNATIQAAPGAGLKLHITDLIISNGATAGNITLLDGSGGTVLVELYPPINGGLTKSFVNPIVLTANTLLAITSTTVTTHSVTVTGFIAP